MIQFFMGDAAARAAAEDHAPEVPPPNDIWIRNASRRLRTLVVAPGAPITVNVFAQSETGSATQNVRKTLTQLGRIHGLAGGVFWVTLTNGRVTGIAQQYIP